MAKYYGDIAKAAKGTRATRGAIQTRAEGLRTRGCGGDARGADAGVREEVCETDVWVCRCVDLFTGGFNYDHKFAFDTKAAGTVSTRAREDAAKRIG